MGQDSDFFVFQGCKCIYDFKTVFSKQQKEVLLYRQPAVAAYFGFEDKYEKYVAGGPWDAFHRNTVATQLIDVVC